MLWWSMPTGGYSDCLQYCHSFWYILFCWCWSVCLWWMYLPPICLWQERADTRRSGWKQIIRLQDRLKNEWQKPTRRQALWKRSQRIKPFLQRAVIFIKSWCYFLWEHSWEISRRRFSAASQQGYGWAAAVWCGDHSVSCGDLRLQWWRQCYINIRTEVTDFCSGQALF